MKVSISFPPFESEKGVALLSQNRQFQWFNNPTYIYPMVPAFAASFLKHNGIDVMWDDGIAEEMSYSQWKSRLFNEKPDLIMFETKTPVVKKHWHIINEIKEETADSDWTPVIMLCGDHITAHPQESLIYSKVDYVLCGGDYDFGVNNLTQFLEKKVKKLDPGFYWREGGKWSGSEKNTEINWSEGGFVDCKIADSGKRQDYSQNDLDFLPMVDRELTKWKLYAYKNGNYKHLPGSYMMSGRDCWWGRCTFCSWTTTFPGKHFRTRSAENALDEVGNLIDLGVKEIMEDSGSLPVGNWLKEFCEGMISRGYNKKIVMSCNMRINGIKDAETWKLMKKAGFRFVLFGLESGNQETLDKIDKGMKVEEIEPMLKICKAAGLEPHITTMIGYPWEDKAKAMNTINIAKDLFSNGYVDTLQATVVIPYPGTPLHEYCKDNNLLNFTDYDRYDQREQVMKSSLTTGDVKEMTQMLYKTFASPAFVIRKILAIRNLTDIKFIVRAGLKVLGHLMDFKK